jgi:predicted nucleotidyltransferase
MIAIQNTPTPYPEINDLLQELLAGVRAVLGGHFAGMYLEGSLASGDFDAASDIDFIVATDEEVSGEQFASLQVMHDRLATRDTVWAIQLEGSYISLPALRRYDPANATHPNIERGEGERLKVVHHDYAGVIHRSILREHGITLAGPAPQTLVDPVSPDDLREAVREIIPVWGGRLLADPTVVQQQCGYQSYIVLSLCRMFYTLQHGEVASKATAARWGRQALPSRWTPLIDRAWVTRNNSQGQPPEEDVRGTLEFLKYALEEGKKR